MECRDICSQSDDHTQAHYSMIAHINNGFQVSATLRHNIKEPIF